MVDVAQLVEHVRDGIRATFRDVGHSSLEPLLDALSCVKSAYQNSDCNGRPDEFIRSKAIETASNGLITIGTFVSPENVVSGAYFFINLHGAGLVDDHKNALVSHVLLFFDGVPPNEHRPTPQQHKGNTYVAAYNGFWLGISAQ